MRFHTLHLCNWTATEKNFPDCVFVSCTLCYLCCSCNWYGWMSLQLQVAVNLTVVWGSFWLDIWADLALFPSWIITRLTGGKPKLTLVVQLLIKSLGSGLKGSNWAAFPARAAVPRNHSWSRAYRNCLFGVFGFLSVELPETGIVGVQKWWQYHGVSLALGLSWAMRKAEALTDGECREYCSAVGLAVLTRFYCADIWTEVRNWR